MKDRLTYLAYSLAWALVRALPERLARALFRVGADLAVRRQGKGVRRLAANLRRVLPEATEEELAAWTRAGLRSYAQYWLEVFRLPTMGRRRILDGMTTSGEDAVRASLAAGRGVVSVLPHQGNWDVAGAWAGLSGLPFTTVAERLKPEQLFDRFLAFRESLGMEVLPLTGGAAPPYDVLVERLTAGRMICLLGDRDLTARGIPVTFFGATTRFPAGPATLAVRTGAALHPVSLWATPAGWHVHWHPEVTPPETGTESEQAAQMTQTVAERFEQGIREHPADWHMLQRLWLDDLPAGDSRKTELRPRER